MGILSAEFTLAKNGVFLGKPWSFLLRFACKTVHELGSATTPVKVYQQSTSRKPYSYVVSLPLEPKIKRKHYFCFQILIGARLKPSLIRWTKLHLNSRR